MGTDGTILKLQDLEKAYGAFRLGPISLDFQRGYVYAIMGPNGCGKSTLFRSVTRMVHPEAGEILLNGQPTGPDDMERKRLVAYVPEQLDLHDESWTFKEWADFTKLWYPNWNRELYRSLTERYGLDEGKKISGFSKGMKRKAAFVLALCQMPELLLLDEPSSGLDPFAWRMMMEDISEYMQQQGRTVVMASHVLEEINRLADYVVFLHDGKSLGLYEKDSLLEDWKCFWIDRAPEEASEIVGVVAVEPELPIRLITNSPNASKEALEQQGIRIHKSKTLELDEIFSQLVRSKEKSKLPKGASTR